MTSSLPLAVAQIPGPSQDNPWLAVCSSTDPISAEYEKSKDIAVLQKSMETLVRDAIVFTEQEILSLILHASSMEQKDLSQQRLASRLVAFRLAKLCQDESELKMLEAATSRWYSSLELTVQAAVTVLDWRFPNATKALIQRVVLERNELDWLQSHISSHLTSLAVANGDQVELEQLRKRLTELMESPQPPKPSEFYFGSVRYDEETKRKATTHWQLVRAIEESLDVERVCQELEPEKQPRFRDFYRRLVQALACRPTGFRGNDEEYRRAANHMIRRDQDREFYSLFFTKVSQSDSATHLVTQLYIEAKTPSDLEIIGKAAQRKDQKGQFAREILSRWKRL